MNELKKITLPKEKDNILFCMDVKTLYPSVPRREARFAVSDALEQRPDHNTDKDTILRLMDVVLENNIFSFDENYYIQTEGTAIGSKLGRNYACTYLGKWEQTLLENAKLKPLIFFRYIDDIWGVWPHSKESLLEF